MNAIPTASSNSETTTTVIFPLVTYGVRPDIPCTVASREPVVKVGNLATTAAVIAVAAVGFLMLTGRVDWRRGLTVVIGAFIIFGAVSIVAGIRSLSGGLH